MQLISDYRDLARHLARITAHVNCMAALRDQKGISRRKRVEHNQVLKKAMKEQNEVICQIFNNEMEVRDEQ